MTQAALFEERVLFSPNLPVAVNQLLQEAVAASHINKGLAEQLFKQAQQSDSTCLQTYFALYKFIFIKANYRKLKPRCVPDWLSCPARRIPNDCRQ